MKKILFLSLVFILLLCNVTQAQKYNDSEYTSALGGKFWAYGVGITFKQFLPNRNAVELVGHIWNDGGRFSGMYQFHYNIKGAEGLKWYIGPEAHIAVYNNHKNERFYFKNWDSGTYLGVGGVIGFDYKFSEMPINISLDWQPSFEFGNDHGFIGAWGGFAVRYTFN
ncbi:MAG: hypothetical protein ACK57K_01390 [Chryseotalea sp.]|jgi:hypothetical protein